MKYFFISVLLLALASLSYAEGPLYKQKERFAHLEFDNVYQDLRGKQSSIPVMTESALKGSAPKAANLLFICSDCATDGLVISTGTTIGAVGRISSKTTAID